MCGMKNNFIKKIAACVTAAAVALTGISVLAVNVSPEKAYAEETKKNYEVHGMWVSFYDIEDKDVGLKTDDEATFRAKAEDLLTDFKDYDINTVYFQVRAFDDAAWKSNTFPAMTYISPKASSLGSANRRQTAAQTLSFDPLEIMTEVAHENGMNLIAWMNPYRVTWSYFLNPGSSKAINRTVTAVKEVLKYDVDGIIFDDYFYHATKGYKNTPTGKTVLTASKAKKLSKATKAKNVNKLVKKVYSTIKAADPSVTFGISPQGNLTNDEAGGADVKTWLSKEGYIDYLMPQLYWTDSWGEDGDVDMFTQRLTQFTSPELNILGKTEYIALSLSRCNTDIASDPGWTMSDSNLAEQYQMLRTAGCKGYSLFSARYIYKDNTANELGYLNEAIEGAAN